MNPNLTLFAQAAAFALFIWFTMRFVWPPLLRAIETRQKTIADGLAEAERGRSSLADAQKQTEVLLREARARAQEIVISAEKSAAQRVEESKVQAKTEGERLVAAAKAQIEQEVQSAKQQLREQVASLAVSGAEKILRREVDAKSHADMLNQLKAQL
jgi:F-type H+-transporting ATPase subunit b